MCACGSAKPIKEIQVGDEVVATDPATGATASRSVTALHVNKDTDLTDVTVRVVKPATASAGEAGRHAGVSAKAPGTAKAPGAVKVPGRAKRLAAAAAVFAGLAVGGTAVLLTTAHHPFWDQTAQTWVNAESLTPGHRLRTVDGATVVVTEVADRTGDQQMRDLTVDTTHTYYVLAGKTPVLVHNCGTGKGPAADNYRGRYNADRAANGKLRLPADYDAHHAVPQYYRDHPELEDFDFDALSNIRGVQGSRAGPGNNVHQEITNLWSDFQRAAPNASRSSIEWFAGHIDQTYGHRFW